MVSYEIFIQDYFNLNPEGDPQKTYEYLRDTIDMLLLDGSKTFHNTDYNFSFFVNQYKDYLDWWDRSFGKKDPQYIRRDDKKLSPYDFIGKEKYKEIYSSGSNPRDKYVFGPYTPQKLRQALLKFKDIINGNEEDPETGLTEREKRTGKSDFDVLSDEGEEFFE